MQRRRIHISWFIAWAATGVLAATALCIVIPPDIFAAPAWPLLAISLFFVAALRRVVTFILLAFVAGGLLGLWRGSALQAGLQAYRPFYMRQVELQGSLAEDASFGKQGDQRWQLRAVSINGMSVPGKVWISTTSRVAAKRGDIVVVRGALHQGFGSMPASMFRADLQKWIRPQPGDVARRVRDWFADNVRRAIPEPEASLGVGYLVGQHSTLPETLHEQLRLVGLTHVVVASGYNLTVLVRAARRLLASKSKYVATLVGSLLIMGFILTAGLSPSMSRAGLVAGLGLATWYYGRSMHPLVLLPFAAACTVLAQPSFMWGDLGWYLSFAAFAGVIVLAPLLQRYFWGVRPPGIVRQVMVETLAAQMATAPIILAAFGQFSPFALPVNILVLPLVPAAMLCTFVAGWVAAVLPGLAPIGGWPALLILRYTTKVVDWFAQLPGSQETVEFGATGLVLSYVVLLVMLAWMRWATGMRLKNSDIIR